jgi:enterobactin synthetase component D
MPDPALPACLDDLQVLPWGEGLWLARCQYQPEAFRADHFASAGIACPPAVATAAAKRGCEYLAGRVCARAAMAAAGVHDAPPGLHQDRSPAWPARVVGAITHSRGRAAALVGDTARWRGLGLDAEAWLAPARAERLGGQILTAQERRSLAALDEVARARRATLTFSVKESLFKALYPLTGRRFYFQDAALVQDKACQDTHRNEHQDTHQAGQLDGQLEDTHRNAGDIVLLTALSPAWPAGTRVRFQWHEAPHGVLSWIAVPAAG